ncbi:MAG: polymer-forming cytoskeletal protein [Pseudomonadota bacterium]|nr:polymer-forming cytoskeletal protein [Pseudomonadota bacterium]
MFSKSKITDPIDTKADDSASRPAAPAPAAPPRPGAPAAAPKPKAPPSILSSDLVVTGNLKTTGDIQVEGTVDGDIRAHLLTVGESATIRGEIVADDVVVNGRVVGRVRGVKVRLTSSAKVEGDIIHKTIAIESGAHFEGSVQRNDDPLSDGGSKPAPTISTPISEG